MTDEEIMKSSHWAIIENVLVHHEGDERSKTNPGHGFPAHTTNYKEYKPYSNKTRLMDALKHKSKYSNSFVIIWAEPHKIVTTIDIENV